VMSRKRGRGRGSCSLSVEGPPQTGAGAAHRRLARSSQPPDPFLLSSSTSQTESHETHRAGFK
jgi:hypothetical protein